MDGPSARVERDLTGFVLGRQHPAGDLGRGGDLGAALHQGQCEEAVRRSMAAGTVLRRVGR